MYKAVIFDMDGTLLDTVDDIRDCLNEIMKRYGCPEHTLDEVRSFLGYGGRRLIELALPEGAADPRFEEILSAYVALYGKNCAVKTRPYDGIPEAVAELLRRGVLLGASSNKGETEVKLLAERWFPGDFGAIAGNVPGRKTKPSPEGLFAVLDGLGVKPEDAVYVGDGDTDIKTAANGGIDCVSVSWGFRSREELLAAGATRVADTPAQMMEMLIGG